MRLLLRPQHWLVSLADLIKQVQPLLRLDAPLHQALPMHVRALEAVAGQLGNNMTPKHRDAAVTGIIKR